MSILSIIILIGTIAMVVVTIFIVTSYLKGFFGEMIKDLRKKK